MKQFLAILSIIALAETAKAEFFGIVCFIDYKTVGVAVNGNKKCSPIQLTTSVAVEDFSNLVVGDGFTFSGNETAKIVSIDSIGSVYLQRVIGDWVDKKGRYYSFADFESLVIYDSKSKPSSQTFAYELYPNSVDRWNLMLSGTTGVSVGILRQLFDKQGEYHIEVCLYKDDSPARKRECSTLSRYNQQ